MGRKIDDDDEIFDELDELEGEEDFGDDEDEIGDYDAPVTKKKETKAPRHKVNEKIQLDGKFLVMNDALKFKSLEGKVYKISNTKENEIKKYRAIVYHEVQITAIIDDESLSEPSLKVMNYI